jgi:outer membrane protein OmpU
MKKLLLSATALTMLAGAAAADVTVGGDARFGIVYDGGGLAAGTNTGNTEVRQRVRVHFNMSTETDSGATIGAHIGLDSRTEDGVGTGINVGTARQLQSTIFANIAGFDFTLGNTNGAVIEKVGLLSGGLGFDGSLGRPGVTAGFDGDENENQTVRLGYSFGDFSVAISTAISGDTDTEVAAKYSATGITVAVGADDAAGGSNWAASAAYSANNFTVGVIIVDGVSYTDMNYRVYGSYVMGGTTFGANYTEVDAAQAAFGIGVSQDLGGGVKAHFAVGQDTAGDTVGQLGMTIGF